MVIKICPRDSFLSQALFCYEAQISSVNLIDVTYEMHITENWHVEFPSFKMGNLYFIKPIMQDANAP